MRESEPSDIPDLLEKWVYGWVVSRGTASAAPLAGGGFRIDVGAPGHTVRYVLPDRSLSRVEHLALSEAAVGVWLKVCASADDVRPRLPAQWTITAPEFLMACRVHAKCDLDACDDYRVTLATTGALTEVRIKSTDGDLAARAKMVTVDDCAMFDEVVTGPEHRRKGLGSLAMNALWNHALTLGISRGVLVATEEGLRLYESLGWHVSSPMTAACIR